jgi:Uma2 family endonuclease
MPTDQHQRVLDALFVILLAYAKKFGGRARTSGIRVRLEASLFRQPDVVYLSAERDHLRGQEYWSGADLVIEVVSGSADDRARDLVTKRREYANAGIPEYWIVDLESETITVLRLEDRAYAEHGVFRRGMVATSVALPGLTAAVDEALDAA